MLPGRTIGRDMALSPTNHSSTRIKELNVAHLIKRKYLRRGFEWHPKTLRLYLHIALTAAATINVGRNKEYFSYLCVFSVRSAAGSISRRVVIFMYQMERRACRPQRELITLCVCVREEAFSFSFTRSHVKQFLVIVLPFTACFSRWLLPYRGGEVYEP
jgi:hypothetical protein